MELEPKFGQIIQQDKPNTTAQLLQGSSGARAKIWSNFTTRQAYSLRHSYSKVPVELEPKFGQIIQQDQLNTTAQLLQGSSGARDKIWSNFTTRQAYSLRHSYSKALVELESQNLVKLYKTSLLTTAQLLQGSSGAREPKFGQIIQND